MSFNTRTYRISNLVVGTVIMMMSLNWGYQNAWQYYFWNFSAGWRCGVGMPKNEELILQILLGAIGVFLSTRVIENKIRPVVGGLFQFVLVVGGLYLEILRATRWG